MKILQVNCHYNYGSTGKIMFDVSNYLVEQGHEAIQCYSRGKTVRQKNVYRLANEFVCKVGKLINMVTNHPLAWGSYSTDNLIKVIERENPDVVHLHCINAYTLNVYKLLDYLKNRKVKTLVTLHAEFMYTAGCGYALECNQWQDPVGCQNCAIKPATSMHENWKRMFAAFQGFDQDKIIVTSVSPWLRDRAMRSTILKEYRHEVVLNGIDTNVFCRQEDLPSSFQKPKGRFILHVTSDYNAPIKGGKYITELAERFLADGDTETRVVVIGPCAEKPNLPNMDFLGVIRDQVALAWYYSHASLTCLTSVKETFSMICAESLCCGTRIVGFNAGAPETISIPEYSNFFEQGNMEGLYQCIKSHLESSNDDPRKIEAVAENVYSAKVMAENYLHLYKELQNAGAKK